MEYKCALCEKILSKPNSGTTGLIANAYNDKYYCNECIEAVQFADMVSSVKAKPVLKEININNTKTVSVSVNIYTCVKCNNQVSGNNCPDCGTPSPLTRRKNNKKKFNY